MIKHLHFLFASILMLAFGMSSSAQEVVFDFTPTDSYTMLGLTGTSNNGNEGDIVETKTLTNGDVTFSITENPSATSSSTYNRFWFNTKGMNEIRLYGGSFTISSTKNILNITIVTGSKCKLSTTVGTLDKKVWTPTEDTKSVEFTAGSRTDLQKITVTLAEGGATPEPQPTEPVVILEESFATSLGDFTIEGEKIWFWGQDEKCMKMSAFGNPVNDGSYLVSPEFCVAEQGTVSFRESVDYDWMSAIANNAGFYIRTVGGEWTKIEGLTFPMSLTFGGTAMDVTLDIPAEFYNKNVQVAFGYKTAGDQITWYVNNFVVKGIPGTAEPVDPQPTETIAENIAAFNALCVKDGVDVTLKLVDAQVLYVNEYVDKKGNNKQEVFVRDASGSVMFYNAGLTVKAGDIMNGEVKGSAKDYFGTKEFCSNANTDLTTITTTDGEATATEMTIPEITDTEVSNLLLVKDVTMISKEETDSKGKVHTNYYLVDAEGNELAYYNKFHIAGLDAQDFVGKESHIFVGVITLNYGKIQLCPTEDAVSTSIDCIENVELDVNAPMYNVAGQKVNANYKGIVLQNGKKFINK